MLSIRLRTAMENMPKVIGEGYGAIMMYINELGEQPVNAPYTAYYNLDMQDMDVEMGFPVARVLAGKGDMAKRLRSGVKPAATSL